MKTAVMYGAGNIGRGFIGALLAHSGYHVTFIDVAEDVIDAINALGRYPVCTSDGVTSEETWVENISAVNGNDADAAAQAIAECEFLCTSVGAKALRFIAPNLAAGVKARLAAGRGPLDILICENLMDADAYLEGLLRQYLTAEEMEQIGLVETSVGRMVPAQTPEMKGDHPLRICTEPYFFLPVDSSAFKGPIPPVRNLVPHSPFRYYVERKLYNHNMAHAVTAYLGEYLNIALIRDAIAVPEIRLLVNGAILESATALSKKYGASPVKLHEHAVNLLYRFQNPGLDDTCARVGADVPRKLAANDRLVGAARSVEEQGGKPVYLCLGIAAALRQYLAEQGAEQTEGNAAGALRTFSGLDAGDFISECALRLYGRFAANEPIAAVLRAADREKALANTENI